MRSLIINLLHFFYVYGWTMIELLLLVLAIWLAIKIKKIAKIFVYLSIGLFLLAGVAVVFNNDFIAGSLGDIIFILLIVSSTTFFIRERKE